MDAGAKVLWGRCHEADVAPAYWPWVPVLRELPRAELSPQVAALLSADTVAAAADAQSSALRTYDAVARLLADESRERPLVVVIEDLHWADTASLQLLAHAAEQLLDARVLLIGTIRVPDAVPAGLQACLAALGRLAARRLHLTGLDAEEVRRLVEETLDRELDADLADVLAGRTDGNPFFVLELVRLLDAEHRLHLAGAQQVSVPDGVQDVLRLRLGRLPEDVQRLLTVASVCGRTFDQALLSAVAGDDPGQTLALLEQALDAQVIEEDEELGRYRFTHALVRETLYAGLSRTRRGGLHAECGSVLEGRLATRPELIAEVAHHLVLGAALRPELAPDAARHAVAAARQAEGRGALDRALVHWQQALSADDLTGEPDEDRRFGILLGLGRARYRQGDIAGSRDALDAAVALASSRGDMEQMAQAATSFRGAGVWHWREFGTSDPAMVAVLETCRQQLPDGPLQARVLASLGMELVYEWRSMEGEQVSRSSMAVARTVGDPELLVDVGTLRHLVVFGRPGSPPELIALAEELLSLPLSQEQELYVRFFAANAHLQAAEAGAADRQAARCIELARRLRHTGADVPLAWWLFYRAVANDDPEAERLLSRALDRHRRSSVVAVDDMEPMARIRLTGPGSPVSPEMVASARDHANPAFRAFVAHALAEAGDPEVAVQLLGDPVPEGAWDYASMYGDCLRVDVLAAAERVDELPAALRRIEPWQDELATFGSTDCIGSVAYFVGRGRQALGELEPARTAYRRAVEVNRAANVQPWLRRAVDRSEVRAAT
jgi:tetratricopeptide (TPR) repeat protein